MRDKTERLDTAFVTRPSANAASLRSGLIAAPAEARRCSEDSDTTTHCANEGCAWSPVVNSQHQYFGVRSPVDSNSAMSLDSGERTSDHWPLSNSGCDSRWERGSHSLDSLRLSSGQTDDNLLGNGSAFQQQLPHAVFSSTSMHSSFEAASRYFSQDFDRGDSSGQQKVSLMRAATSPVAHADRPFAANRHDMDSSCWEMLSKRNSTSLPDVMSEDEAGSQPTLAPNHFAHATATISPGSTPSRRANRTGSLLVRQESGSSEGKWTCLSDNQAAVQLFYRLRNCRQTVEFARRQRALYSRLDKALYSIPQAFEELDTLREYESALMSSSGCSSPVPLSLAAHARQTAEACRLRHPDQEWLQLAGLLHPLGKLLAHRRFGSQAQWAICGESFPLGCAFSPELPIAEAFCNNPDRRRRLYTTQLGMYTRGCGLRNVEMSWGCGEYVYLLMTLNRIKPPLPPATLWLLRFHSFRSLLGPAPAYDYLLDDFDRSMLPWLRELQDLSAFRHMTLPGRLDAAQLQEHHAKLLDRHHLSQALRW